MGLQIRRHAPFALYILSLVWLLISASAAYAEEVGGIENVRAIALLIIATIIFYYFFWRTIGVRSTRRLTFADEAGQQNERSWTSWCLIILTGIYLLVIIGHYLMIGSLPLITILNAKTDIGISIVRQDGYFGLPVWGRYASDICIKSLGPILLVLTAYLGSRLFWLVLFAGVIYTTMLIARSLPLLLLLPLLLFYVVSLRWVRAAMVAGLAAALLLTLTTVSSITMRNTARHDLSPSSSSLPGKPPPNDLLTQDGRPPQSLSWKQRSPIYAIYERALLVPGRVIEQWFAFYRTNLHENGCAYQRIAPLLRCNFVNVPTKLYEHYYPENIGAGMYGSLNAASFMTEWANFGMFGMIVAAVMASSLFTLITIIYGAHPLAIPMNAVVILSLLETGFFTALASGSGWLITTAIFVLFFRRFRNS